MEKEKCIVRMCSICGRYSLHIKNEKYPEVFVCSNCQARYDGSLSRERTATIGGGGAEAW